MTDPLSAYIHRSWLVDSTGAQSENVNKIATYVWDTSLLQWVKATSTGGGGGGGGNAAAGLTGTTVPTSAGYTAWNKGGNLTGVSMGDPLPIQPGIGVSFAVTGTVTANQGTDPWNVSGTVDTGARGWTLSNSTDSVQVYGSVAVAGTVDTGSRGWTLNSSTDSVNASQQGSWAVGRTWNLVATMDNVGSYQNGKWYSRVVDDAGNIATTIGDGVSQVGLGVSMVATNFVTTNNNSTSTQLAAGTTYTGTIETIFNQQDISLLITCDQPAILTINQYIDNAGAHLISSWVYTLTAPIVFSRSFVANGNYFNLSFKNTGGAATTTLLINTTYGTIPAVSNLGNQTTALNEVNGAALSLGQAAMTSSLPVVIANNQTAISVTPNAGSVFSVQPGAGATFAVTQATITKGTQGANGVTTQDLKDAGRNVSNLFTASNIALTASDALVSLTGYKSGAAVTATTTPAVVTSGKTLRVQSLVISYIATSTTLGSVQVTLRANTGGVVAIGSPAVSSWVVGVVVAAEVAGQVVTVEVPIPDGLEFAAGTGIGLSVIGYVGTTATAVGSIRATLLGYEY